MGETRIQVFIYVTIVVFAVVAVDRDDEITSCPGPLRYYKDLGCTPVYTSEFNRCAIRYNCDHINKRSRIKCYINGHEYNPSEMLRQEDRNPCDEICICFRGNKSDEIAAFNCIDTLSYCPKFSTQPGCYLKRDPSKCCRDPKSQICLESFFERPTCIVDNERYFDGDIFYVKEDPDLTCVCLSGYKGENVPPFCIKSNHSNCAHPAFSHIDHFGNRCAPIYINRRRNPNECYTKMRCQNPNDQIIPYDRESNSKDKCLFGNLTLQIGDQLKPFTNNTVNCIQCTCEVPPVLTCEFLTENRLCNV